MTCEDIVTAVIDNTHGVEGVHSGLILNWIDQGHKHIHRQLDVQDTLATESFTWAVVDGTEKDITSDLTRWQGKPQRVSDASRTQEWAARDIIEVLNRQEHSETNYYGQFVYAVVGTTKLLIAETPSAALTVSVRHYQRPADLDDMSDLPVLPSQFDTILVEWAEAQVWKYAAMMAGDSSTRTTMYNNYQETRERFDKAYKKLVVAVNKAQQVTHTMEPDAIARAGRSAEQSRRDYW